MAAPIQIAQISDQILHNCYQARSTPQGPYYQIKADVAALIPGLPAGFYGFERWSLVLSIIIF
jgi:hypothetical protein